MKKITFVLFVAFIFSFFSCRKDMSCTCEYVTTSTGPIGSGITTTSETKTLDHVTKSEGRVNCMSRKYSVTYYTILGDSLTDTVVTCDLS